MAVTTYTHSGQEVRYVGSPQPLWIKTATGAILTDAEKAAVVTSSASG